MLCVTKYRGLGGGGGGRRRNTRHNEINDKGYQITVKIGKFVESECSCRHLWFWKQRNIGGNRKFEQCYKRKTKTEATSPGCPSLENPCASLPALLSITELEQILVIAPPEGLRSSLHQRNRRQYVDSTPTSNAGIIDTVYVIPSITYLRFLLFCQVYSSLKSTEIKICRL